MTFLVNLLLQILFPTLLLILLGYSFIERKAKLAKRVIGIGLLTLTLLSLPIVANALIYWLENLPQTNTPAAEAQAIIVLAAGVGFSQEYGGFDVGANTLLRMRYGATLARKTGLPLLLTGGNPDERPHSEAWYMRQVLIEEFRQPVKWIEEASNNTAESAQHSAAILKAQNIKTAYLVTHASHMVRASLDFEKAGITVIPASTVFSGFKPGIGWRGFIPNAGALQQTHEVLHEIVGIGLYWLKHSFAR